LQARAGEVPRAGVERRGSMAILLRVCAGLTVAGALWGLFGGAVNVNIIWFFAGVLFALILVALAMALDNQKKILFRLTLPPPQVSKFPSEPMQPAQPSRPQTCPVCGVSYDGGELPSCPGCGCKPGQRQGQRKEGRI
jgi:hypothetical protein